MHTSQRSILAAFLPALVACAQTAPPRATPTPVRVRAVGESPGSSDLHYSGTVQADAEVALAFKVGGYVDSVRAVPGSRGETRLVQAGDRVTKGTVLAVVRDSDYRQRVAELRAQRDQAHAEALQAKLDHERAAKLLALEAISQAAYDAQKARFDATAAAVDAYSARLRQAQINLDDCSLRAPVDGIVVRRDIEVGSLVNVGSPGFVVAAVGRTKVRFGVPDEVALRLKLGSSVRVTAEPIPGRTFAAEVTKVSPKSDSSTRVFDVEASLAEDGPLRLGMVVSVALPDAPAPAASALTLPLPAIVKTPGEDAFVAYAVEAGAGGAEVARARKVTLGRLAGNEVRVEGDLRPGDRVVVQGASLVADGQAVRVVP